MDTDRENWGKGGKSKKANKIEPNTPQLLKIGRKVAYNTLNK
jgi:hypothetical protein